MGSVVSCRSGSAVGVQGHASTGMPTSSSGMTTADTQFLTTKRLMQKPPKPLQKHQYTVSMLVAAAHAGPFLPASSQGSVKQTLDNPSTTVTDETCTEMTTPIQK